MGRMNHTAMTDEQITEQLNGLISSVCSLKADFCHDLNAMYEAEFRLSPFEDVEYYHQLLKMNDGDEYNAARSTARQRAVAFCRALRFIKE